ncbi:MAG TPA: TIGR00269 family protein [Ignisphaera aggregans]|uniref:TIGR00269 family protein n=1 Tax=Ignisphaera aggregans TaxID=334771 RepID=A0A832YZV3_9CREN|nr:TIGR00269 family protein [Ignisphaera aggregans]
MLSPEAKCSFCRREAVARIAYAKLLLCEEHYIEYIRNKVRRTILRYNLANRGDKILLAVSGGKDSLTLLDIMYALSQEMRFSVAVLHIDLGIEGYSEQLKHSVESHTQKLGVPLITLSLRDILGVTLPQLSKRSRRPPCSVCGIVKRYLMNACAIESGATAVATGHTADDVIAYAIKSFILQDYSSLSKLVPKTKALQGAISRIRPLYEVYERETLLYSVLKRLPFHHGMCPYVVRNSLERHVKRFFNQIEELFPSTKISFLRRLAKHAETLTPVETERKSIRTCDVCGLIASDHKCSFCKVTESAVGMPLGREVRDYISSMVKEIWS